MEHSRDLRSIEVVVKYKLGDSPSEKFTVKFKQTDTLRKTKKHITESLDIQGRVTYGEINCDAYPSKKLSDCTPKQEEKFLLTAERKRRELRELKLHTVQLKMAQEFLTKDEGTTEIKVARTTTIENLKHKLQNRLGVPTEDLSIHVPGQGKECQASTCVMQLPQPIVLEVKGHKKDGSPLLKPSIGVGKRTLPQRSSNTSSGAPYDTKPSCKRKPQEVSSKKPNRKTETEGSQSTLSVPVEHATYETLHQLGENFEEFKKDKTKTLVVACKHSKENNQVEITSTLLTGNGKLVTAEFGSSKTMFLPQEYRKAYSCHE